MQISDESMKPTQDGIAIPSHFILELYEGYQDMAQACLNVKEAINQDEGEYPIFMPTYGDSDTDHYSNAARVAAVESITQLFYQTESDVFHREGILCASPKTVAKIKHLNDTKSQFKAAVLAIRNYGKGEDVNFPASRFTSEINNQITKKGVRCKALTKAMGTAGISALDLKRCYSEIRVLPPALQAFSWTWATTHSRAQRTTVAEVMTEIEAIEDGPKKDSMIAALAQCNSIEPLVSKVRLPNQLRANYSYLSTDEKVARKSCTISGVVIAQQKHLPRHHWRKNPGQVDDSQRLARESGIYSDPIIKALGIYRYVAKQ